MVQRKSGNILLQARSLIPFRQNPHECEWLVYEERYLVECFFIKSNIFAELQLVMINWQPPFLPLFIVFLYSICVNSIENVSFQTPPSNYIYFGTSIKLAPDIFRINNTL